MGCWSTVPGDLRARSRPPGGRRAGRAGRRRAPGASCSASTCCGGDLRLLRPRPAPARPAARPPRPSPPPRPRPAGPGRIVLCAWAAAWVRSSSALGDLGLLVPLADEEGRDGEHDQDDDSMTMNVVTRFLFHFDREGQSCSSGAPVQSTTRWSGRDPPGARARARWPRSRSGRGRASCRPSVRGVVGVERPCRGRGAGAGCVVVRRRCRREGRSRRRCAAGPRGRPAAGWPPPAPPAPAAPPARPRGAPPLPRPRPPWRASGSPGSAAACSCASWRRCSACSCCFFVRCWVTSQATSAASDQDDDDDDDPIGRAPWRILLLRRPRTGRSSPHRATRRGAGSCSPQGSGIGGHRLVASTDPSRAAAVW